MDYILLTLFLFTYHIRFILNQIWSTWTKFIEKIFINQVCPARNRPGKWMRLISYSFYIYYMLYYVCSKLNLTNFDQIYIKKYLHTKFIFINPRWNIVTVHPACKPLLLISDLVELRLMSQHFFNFKWRGKTQMLPKNSDKKPDNILGYKETH